MFVNPNCVLDHLESIKNILFMWTLPSESDLICLRWGQCIGLVEWTGRWMNQWKDEWKLHNVLRRTSEPGKFKGKKNKMKP